MKYPKLDITLWKNSKLTLKERDEVDFYINHAGWSWIRVAELYHVSVMTVKYWSDPEYRAKDNVRTTLRMKRNMEDPEYRKRINDNKKDGTIARMRRDPEFREWINGGRYHSERTPEQTESNRVRAYKRYVNNKEKCVALAKRYYRVKNNNGFRMFQKHLNSVSYADNICHSKKETRSTKSFKTLDVSPTQSTLPMVRKLYISLLSILRKISQPIHALKREFLTEDK